MSDNSQWNTQRTPNTAATFDVGHIRVVFLSYRCIVVVWLAVISDSSADSLFQVFRVHHNLKLKVYAILRNLQLLWSPSVNSGLVSEF